MTPKHRLSAVRSETRKKKSAVTAAGAVSADPKKEKVDEIINYEINKVVSKTVMPVGETKKLSIAVSGGRQV